MAKVRRSRFHVVARDGECGGRPGPAPRDGRGRGDEGRLGGGGGHHPAVRRTGRLHRDVADEEPEGRAAPSEEDDFDKQVADIPECKGFVKVFNPTSKTVTASADGASFDKEETLGGATLGGSTLIFKSSADAKKFFLPIKSPKLAKCLDKAMKASIEDSLASGSGDEYSKFESSIERVGAEGR